MIKACRLLAALLIGAGMVAARAADSDDNRIGALGTLQPHGGVAVLAGPGGATIDEILTSVNQPVRKGQVLARLSSYGSAQAELDSVRLDRAEQIATHETDKKQRELDVAKAQSDLKRAERSLANYLGMSEGSQASSIRDERQNQVEDARHALESDQLRQRSLEGSFQIALKKLDNREKQAQATLAQAEIRAPFDGMVLDVQKQIGESAAGPFCSLADISAMEVSAEVFEGDLAKLKPGQSVTVTGKSLPEALTGKLDSVGRSINVDRKVAKALIRLDKSDLAAHYIGMEVNVSIHP